MLFKYEIKKKMIFDNELRNPFQHCREITTVLPWIDEVRESLLISIFCWAVSGRESLESWYLSHCWEAFQFVSNLTTN